MTLPSIWYDSRNYRLRLAMMEIGVDSAAAVNHFYPLECATLDTNGATLLIEVYQVSG